MGGTTTSQKRLLLAVDGGGTKCLARLFDADGALLGEGRAGSANVSYGIPEAFAALTGVAADALAKAGRPAGDLGRLHVGAGMAGLNINAVARAFHAQPHPFASLRATGDAHTACLGAHLGGDGAIIIAGTGSCCFLISGGTARPIGGWGFLTSDHGSGAQLGLAAVRAALLADDEFTPSSPLAGALIAHLGGDPHAVKGWADTAGAAGFAALAPIVLEHAAAGDWLGRELVAVIAADVARMIRAMTARGAAKISLVGGLAAPIMPWLDEAARAALSPPEGDSLDGALMFLRQSLAA